MATSGSEPMDVDGSSENVRRIPRRGSGAPVATAPSEPLTSADASQLNSRTMSQVSDVSASVPPKKPARDPSKSIRIGVILAYPKSEAKKEELILLKDKRRPWARFARKEHIARKMFNKTKPIKLRHKKHECIGADTSIGLYIEWAYGSYGVEVDMILPQDLTQQRCEENDLNFFIIYDLLEAYHTDKTEGRQTYHEMRKLLENCNNVYPSYDYQKFINSKITYYDYLKERDINIAPTLTMAPTRYATEFESNPEKAADHFMTEMKKDNWMKFIVKPVYGQESLALHEGFVGWPEANGWIPAPELKKERKKLVAYLAKTLDKFPGVVFQKFIEGFGDERVSPELRLYYVGQDYEYTMCTCDGSYLRPKEEGGRSNFKWGDKPALQMLKDHTKSLMPQLPPIVIQGKEMPRLLTRFDMGYLDASKPVPPFVNEIEFVPSLYIEETDRLSDKLLGDQMVKITCHLMETSLDVLAANNP